MSWTGKTTFRASPSGLRKFPSSLNSLSRSRPTVSTFRLRGLSLLTEAILSPVRRHHIGAYSSSLFYVTKFCSTLSDALLGALFAEMLSSNSIDRSQLMFNTYAVKSIHFSIQNRPDLGRPSARHKRAKKFKLYGSNVTLRCLCDTACCIQYLHRVLNSTCTARTCASPWSVCAQSTIYTALAREWICRLPRIHPCQVRWLRRSKLLRKNSCQDLAKILSCWTTFTQIKDLSWTNWFIWHTPLWSLLFGVWKSICQGNMGMNHI